MTLTKEDLHGMRAIVTAQIFYLRDLKIHDAPLSRQKEIRINQLTTLDSKLANILDKEYEK